MTTKPKHVTTRTAARLRAADLRRAAQQEAAQRREDADEAIAPAIQRNAVLTPSRAKPDVVTYHGKGKGVTVVKGDVVDQGGAVLRAARVQRDGVAFIRVSPLAWMAANIERAEQAGAQATFTRQHVAAASRLVSAWDAVGDGVGLGASDWGSLRAPKGKAPMTPAGHSALVSQVEQRVEIEAAHTWLGSLWPCIEAVALRGMSPAAWADKAGLHRQVGAGFLMAALGRLVEFYRERDAVPARQARIRSVSVIAA